MKKLIALFLALVLVGPPVFAAVGVWNSGSPTGTVSDIEVTGSTATIVNGRLKFPLVLAGGANGGAATMTTTDTAVSTSYTLIRKAIGIQVGLAGTLADGSPGQIISILISTRASSGTFVLTPTTKTGFSYLTFDAAGENASLMFVDSTTGWVLLSSTATVTQ